MEQWDKIFLLEQHEHCNKRPQWNNELLQAKRLGKSDWALDVM
jgi:hypothetical protein